MPSQTQSDIIATLSSCALSDIDAVLTPGECNVMLAFVDDAARNLSDLEALRAELAELRAQVSAQNDRLAHIAEYWNGERNDQAMYDALCHIVDEAGSAVPDVFIEHSVMRPPVKTAAVPDDVAKDAKIIRGMEHGQVLMLRRADTKDSSGIGAVSNIGIAPYIHRLDGSKIYLGDHIHGDQFTGVFESVKIPAIEWPDAAILAAKENKP